MRPGTFSLADQRKQRLAQSIEQVDVRHLGHVFLLLTDDFPAAIGGN
jgi:hypothetical protein